MICDNYALIREQVADAAKKSGRKQEDITIVGVSKTYPVEALVEGYGCGIRIFGENKVQEAVPKAEYVKQQFPDAKIHFIGQIQTNKLKYFKDNFSIVQSVDRIDVAEQLSKHSVKINHVQELFLQVNVAGETQKAGVAPEGLFGLVDAVAELPGVAIRGLMMMPPFFDDVERNRPYFAETRRLFEACQAKYGKSEKIAFNDLSMGMSGDFALAIEEGSTMVRVGTAIFGTRNYSAQ